MADGRKTGGRQKGVPNKRTAQLTEKLESLNCDPVEGMARIANGDVPCTTCNEAGKIGYIQFYKLFGLKLPKPISENPADFDSQKIVCPSCDGTKREIIGVRLRGDMFKELAQYVFPKRKAIEHSGEVGHPYVARMPDVADNSEEWQKKYEPKTTH